MRGKIAILGLCALSACNLFNDLGNAWTNSQASDMCSPSGDQGGMAGAGGGAGVGGSDVGSAGVGGGPGAQPQSCDGDVLGGTAPVDCPTAGGAGGGDGQGPVPCSIFSPSLFKFATTIPDDGKDAAGGWQVAAAQLKYVQVVSPYGAWVCSFTVGMPLRTKVDGPISPLVASVITSEVVSDAWLTVRTTFPDLPPGIFCSKFKTEMDQLFFSRYPSKGVIVNKA